MKELVGLLLVAAIVVAVIATIAFAINITIVIARAPPSDRAGMLFLIMLLAGLAIAGLSIYLSSN